MSVRVQPAMAISPDSEPPLASQRWAAVWRSLWGWNPHNAGSLGAPAQGAAQPVVAEASSPLAEPQVSCVGEAVPVSQGEVAAECLNGGRSDRDDSACAALATADMDQAVDQVEIPDLEGNDFADSDAGFEHEPDDRLVAAMVEGLVRSGSVRGRAGTDECSELVVGQRFDHGLIDLRRLHSPERVAG